MLRFNSAQDALGNIDLHVVGYYWTIWGALQIQDQSPQSRPVVSCNQ